MYDKFNKLMDRLFYFDRDDYAKVQDATSRIETIDDDEWDEIYSSVCNLGKQAMDLCARTFADDAIGDASWRWGTDHED